MREKIAEIRGMLGGMLVCHCIVADQPSPFPARCGLSRTFSRSRLTGVIADVRARIIRDQSSEVSRIPGAGDPPDQAC
jgi:hypothetical protein